MTAPGPTIPSLRVATWNIHDARGTTGQRNLERVADVLGELRAPIIGLQEVRCGGATCDAAILARRHGYDWRTIGTRRHAEVEHGNALLTTLPVLGTREHNLSVARREPRAALEVELRWQARRLRVVVTHLGLRAGERRVQVERLLAHLPADDAITILLGDINEWWLWGRPLRWLHRRFGMSPSLRTYPAHLPLFALDRIWVSSPWLVTAVAALGGPHARTASDHLPLIATLAARPAQDG
jgi:endonuclease/exonuclease/phosphatase family metal-dependent hydrolase